MVPWSQGLRNLEKPRNLPLATFPFFLFNSGMQPHLPLLIVGKM